MGYKQMHHFEFKVVKKRLAEKIINKKDKEMNRDMLHLKNEYYQLNINEDNGAIASFLYREKNLLSEKQPPLFKVRFRTEAGDAVCYDANDMSSCETLCEDNKLTLTYCLESEANIKVVITVVGDACCSGS